MGIFLYLKRTSEAAFIINLQSVLSFIASQLNRVSSEVLGVLKRAT